MPSTHFFDIALSVLVVLGLGALVAVKGDALYVGAWYYTVIPFVIIGLCALLKPKPFFLLGASLGLAATYVVYLAINWRSEDPEGLLALGHLFSLPGALIAVLAVASRSRHRNSVTPIMGFAYGAGGLITGFCINQLVVCNTLMWCGPFSFSWFFR